MSKKILLRWGFLCLSCVFATVAGAQTTTVKWAMDDATIDDSNQPNCEITSDFDGEITEILTSPTVSWGNNLYWGGSYDWTYAGATQTFTLFDPWAKHNTSAANYDEDAVVFKVNVADGYKFTPTNFSLDMIKKGTDGVTGGSVDFKLVCDDTSEGMEFASVSWDDIYRVDDANQNPWTSYSCEIVDADAATESFEVWMKISNYNADKGFGVANVVIEGNLQDEKDEAINYHVTFSPGQGDALEDALSVISVTANGPVTLGSNTLILVNDADGNLKTYGSETQEVKDEDGVVIGYDVTLNTPIQDIETGTYSYTVPENFLTFLKEDINESIGSPATTVTFSITSDKCIYSTDFTDWDALGYTDTEEPVDVTVTTNYTDEDVTFSLFGVQVDPAGWNEKFSDDTGEGFLATAKYIPEELIDTIQPEFTAGYPYVQISEIKSVTKIKFTQAATGSYRGITVSVKGVDANGKVDEDWVTLFDSYINQAGSGSYATNNSGRVDTEEVEVNRTLCQILIEPIDSAEIGVQQNAYITEFKIYGDIDKVIEYPYTFTTDPEDGANVESISTVSVQTEDGIIAFNTIGEYVTSDVKVYSVNEEGGLGDVVATASSRVSIPNNSDDPTIGFTFTFDKTITEDGSYIIYIPAGMFYCGSATNMSEEMMINVQIGDTGINNVMMDATSGDNKVYNLSGQRVSNPNHGIFITNGKKILVK